MHPLPAPSTAAWRGRRSRPRAPVPARSRTGPPPVPSPTGSRTRRSGRRPAGGGAAAPPSGPDPTTTAPSPGPVTRDRPLRQPQRGPRHVHARPDSGVVPHVRRVPPLPPPVHAYRLGRHLAVLHTERLRERAQRVLP